MTDTLYTIPQNWQWFKLGEVCNFERGITFPANAKENKLTEKNIPCIRTANVQSELDITDLIYIDKSYTKNNSAKLLKSGDIIMSSANSRELVGKTCYVKSVNFEMTFGGFVTVIRSENIFSKYIFYFLRYEFLMGKFMSESTQTVNIANINTSTLSNYSCPVPPLAEQKRIVERIDSLFEKLDAAKKILQDIVDGYELRRAAILHRAFTGELTEDFRKINNLSLDDWQEKKLGEICKIGSGGTPSRKNLKNYGGKIAWVKTGEIYWNEIFDTEEKITIEGLNNSSAKIYPVGTVLVAMYGQGLTRGRASVLKIEASTNQAVCALCPFDSVHNQYLYYFFMANYWKLREKAFGGNQPNYSATMISKLPIDLPSLEEQKEISRRLDSLIGKENQAKEIAEKLLSEIETLKKAILARAFRGELGTNNPAENVVEHFEIERE